MTADKDLDARRREAASWFATLNQKRVTAADVTAFSQWRRDPKNAEAYARIETMWETAGSLKGDADIAVLTKGARARADASRKTQSRFSKALVPTGAIAAIAAAAIGVMIWSARPLSYETGLGEQRVVVLADGSKVTLDTESRITVKLTRGRRAVELASGQAFFDVEGDPTRPFVVRAGVTDVTAVGTRFDVRRAGDGAQVTLVEGRVDVLDREGSSPRWSLTPGQQIVTASPRPAVRSVDVASETSWTAGRLVFAGDTVETAVAEVNRYSRTKVILQAPAISRIAVSGVFNTGDVEGFVSALVELYPVVAERTPTGQIVIRDAPAKMRRSAEGFFRAPSSLSQPASVRVSISGECYAYRSLFHCAWRTDAGGGDAFHRPGANGCRAVPRSRRPAANCTAPLRGPERRANSLFH